MPTSDRLGRTAWIAASAALLLGGCFNPFRPEVSNDPGQTVSASPAPKPTSPRNVMKLFKWCWEQKNITTYEEIFTEDFVFAFAEADTEGNAFPGNVLDRGEELNTARHLFVGGAATEPPANSITLEYRSPLVPQNDSRPGKLAPWHLSFQTDVDLTIRADIVYRIVTKAVFYVVRGDSARIPPEIRDRVLPPGTDPAILRRRWFIERYEDTGPASGLIARSAPSGLALPRPAVASRSGLSAPRAVAAAADVRLSWPRLKSLYYR